MGQFLLDLLLYSTAAFQDNLHPFVYNADKVVLTAKVASVSFYNNWASLIADMGRKRKSCP